MRNWKTTFGACLVAVTGMLSIFGVHLEATIVTAVQTIGIAIIGLFAKDHDKS